MLLLAAAPSIASADCALDVSMLVAGSTIRLQTDSSKGCFSAFESSMYYMA
jgi:hypothetical protein